MLGVLEGVALRLGVIVPEDVTELLEVLELVSDEVGVGLRVLVTDVVGVWLDDKESVELLEGV